MPVKTKEDFHAINNADVSIGSLNQSRKGLMHYRRLIDDIHSIKNVPRKEIYKHF